MLKKKKKKKNLKKKKKKKKKKTITYVDFITKCMKFTPATCHEGIEGEKRYSYTFSLT